MKTTLASAPAKAILFGEHSVVYRHPAIAIPIPQLTASAVVTASSSADITLRLPDLNKIYPYKRKAKSTKHPLLDAIGLVEKQYGKKLPPMNIDVTSLIPIASGLGSGASTSVATIRALLKALKLPASDRLVSELTYEIEKRYHGTPSGIDNTVIAYNRPVYFVKKKKKNLIEPFKSKMKGCLLIADTGVRSETKTVVADVRTLWESNKSVWDHLFEQCGEIAIHAHQLIQSGKDVERLGRLMTLNHQLLQEMTVSSPKLDRMVDSAVDAGAYGAKLSGAGRGGNMIALTSAENESAVADALRRAGARTVIHTSL